VKITHFNNSFISLESDGQSLVCDPWMGKANTGGWQSFPEFKKEDIKEALSKAQWVYISHLHDDHFHPQTLYDLGLLRKKFIIKRFNNPRLYERLKGLGIDEIQEIDPFECQRFGPFNLAVIPQFTSNSSGYADSVNYDLDTSIVFKCDEIVFFNAVDNPLSATDLQIVKTRVTEKFGKIDVACFKTGAASEYPHLFLGIDRYAEKQKVINHSLNKLVDSLSIIDPKYYFPAGGTYLIPGIFGVLNDYIAQPSFVEIVGYLRKYGSDVTPFNLEGGHSIEFEVNETGPTVSRLVRPIEEDCCSPHFDRTVFQEFFQWKRPSKFPRLPRAAAGISRSPRNVPCSLMHLRPEAAFQPSLANTASLPI
jgi:L-ascorbate metabolism protein UlaG (beta-lactamase superfamily)